MAWINTEGTVYHGDRVGDDREATAGEIASSLEAALATVARGTRDRLLAASDFSQLPDAPVDATAWATYRQALRDVPEQAGFPQVIDWPIRP